MKIVKTQKELKEIRANLKPGKTIALVPTMGALHQGHLSLVKLAQQHADIIWVSIFVNPLQFGIGEDLDNYPRSFEEDACKLAELNTDYLWTPSFEEMYPSKPQNIQANHALSNCLCGISRPVFFHGIATTVKTLFEQIQPDLAVFGEKDYQQLLVIKSMVEEFHLPVQIIPGTTIREANGLAMSSRNQYLNAEQQELAGNIYKELSKIKQGISNIDQSKKTLENLDIKVEYLEERWGRIFFAGRIGATRLIDNV